MVLKRRRPTLETANLYRSRHRVGGLGRGFNSGSSRLSKMRIKTGRIKRKHLAIVGIVILAIIFVQLIWPSSRARPFTRVAGQSVSLATQAKIIESTKPVQDEAKLELVFKEKTHLRSFNDLGIVLDGEQSADRALVYTWWQRLIPLSLFFGIIKETPVTNQVDQAKLEKQVKEMIAASNKPAINASLKAIGTTVELGSAKDGYSFQQSAVSDRLAKQIPKSGSQKLEFEAATDKPVRNDESVQAIKSQAEAAITTKTTLSFVDKTAAPDAATIASWLVFSESQDKKQLNLDINPELVAAYLAPLEKSIYIEPGVTKVTTLDGREVSRQNGSNGRGIDKSKSYESLKKLLLESHEPNLDLPVSALPPRVEVARNYSSSAAGLQALLNHLSSSYGDFSISVRDLSGRGWSANVNGGKTYHPASTYKIFTAYSLLKRFESGEIKPSDEATGGKNMEQCLNVMIVRSDNPCPEWLGENRLKWRTQHDDARTLGLSGGTNLLTTSFTSTANDQTLFLEKLQNGNILKPENRDQLLNLMRQQIYRAGIPSGTGAPVADKVGFLNGLLHDSGLVYNPRGTYALSIYSNNGSWGNIAEASKQIDAFMSR